jgi:hypothetical protein
VKGFIYIAGAFHTVNRSKCGQGGTWIDNDPHFWTHPPTWGICRNDLRKKCDPGDYIFFVLPLHGSHPQMIFAYLNICQIITHHEAYHRPDLRKKLMGNKNHNGNIIVDADDAYNRFDFGVHKHKFNRIKNHYAIGDSTKSKILTAKQIQALAPQFLNKLVSVLKPSFSISPTKPFDIITRAGRQLNETQIKSFLTWIGTAV